MQKKYNLYIIFTFFVFVSNIIYGQQRTDVSTLNVSMSWKYRNQVFYLKTDQEDRQFFLEPETQITLNLYGKDTIKIASSDQGGSPSNWINLYVEKGNNYNYEIQRNLTHSALDSRRTPSKQRNHKTETISVSPDWTQIGNLSVKVVDDKGKPLAGVQITDNRYMTSLTTNENGEVFFKYIQKGNGLTFSAAKKNYKTQDFTVNIIAEQTNNASVKLHYEMGNVKVIVFNKESKPMRGVQVTENGYRRTGITNAEGECVLENLKEGNTNISFTLADFESQKQDITVISDSTVIKKISMLRIIDPAKTESPKDRAIIKGVVLNPRGLPDMDAEVEVSGQGKVRTDIDGKFAIAVQPGSISIEAHKPGVVDGKIQRSKPHSVIEAKANQEYSAVLELEVQIYIAEIVTSAPGSKIDDATLQLKLQKIDSLGTNMKALDFQVKLNGERLLNVENILNKIRIPEGKKEYAVDLKLLPEQYDLLRTGSAKLEIEETSYANNPQFKVANSQIKINNISSGSSINPSTPSEVGVGTIEGRIVDVNNIPVQGALVKASNSNKQVTTNSQGYYTLDNIPVGNVVVTASKPGYNILASTINLQKGETAKSPLIAMEASIESASNNKETKMVMLYISFATGKSNIAAPYESDLLKVKKLIENAGGKHFVIEGHTDSDGDAEKNRKLSLKRAEAVREWLIKNGVDAKLLSAAGYGEDRPRESNATPEGRAMNRRVEIRVE